MVRTVRMVRAIKMVKVARKIKMVREVRMRGVSHLCGQPGGQVSVADVSDVVIDGHLSWDYGLYVTSGLGGQWRIGMFGEPNF